MQWCYILLLDFISWTITVSQKGNNTNTRPFSFASYFGDHMVLQGVPHKAVIWGYAPKGSKGLKVTITIGKLQEVYTTHVNTNLTWKQSIGPVKSGGPYTITATLAGGNQSVVLKDILFGDVWVCSGESNMQFSINQVCRGRGNAIINTPYSFVSLHVSFNLNVFTGKHRLTYAPLKSGVVQVFNASFEMKDGLNYPDIRLFVVNYTISNIPLTDFDKYGILLPWSLPSPVTSAGGNFRYFSAVCWLYGKYLYQHLKRPLGLVATSYVDTHIEAWSSQQVLRSCGLSFSKKNNQGNAKRSSVLWNAMVNPLLQMSILGVIWYQGEANAHKNKQFYNCTFPAMIDDWRKQFNANGGSSKMFPFGFVQLSGSIPYYRADSNLALIRWHQTADYGYVPNDRQKNVFMAVAMDLNDFVSPFKPMHPRYKQDVAARLVLGGLKLAYGYNVSFQGPRIVSAKCIVQSPGNYPLLTLEYSMDIKQKSLDGFEICCAFTEPPLCKPGISWWIPAATAREMNTGNTTTLHAMVCKLEQIVGLRYAWRDTPCEFRNCAIYGADNDLPLSPFTLIFDVDGRKFVSNNYFVLNLMRSRTP